MKLLKLPPISKKIWYFMLINWREDNVFSMQCEIIYKDVTFAYA